MFAKQTIGVKGNNDHTRSACTLQSACFRKSGQIFDIHSISVLTLGVCEISSKYLICLKDIMYVKYNTVQTTAMASLKC